MELSKTDHVYSRNDGCPLEGIDTQSITAIGISSACVEMMVARQRALTHDTNTNLILIRIIVEMIVARYRALTPAGFVSYVRLPAADIMAAHR